MERNKILKEILSDEELLKKYKIDKTILVNLTTNPPYNNKLIEVLSVMINDRDNNLNDLQIYRKIKNIHNIG
ncbi:hypothetical protein D1J36_005180 [Riemerella anatipestifer]|uniref:hypothetical protein n=1 Tax=Riemerella anatipestifer TaxID=34085 RepID=UPI0012ADAEC0|nr:hypothetical protein [Riemerella anatipestifer]USL94703.1 hypothetical protein D1J36_005180 [Riemerella anatipestifer]